MQLVKLGATGLEVSRICLGTMTYGSPAWREWVLDAVTAREIEQDDAERARLEETYLPRPGRSYL